MHAYASIFWTLTNCRTRLVFTTRRWFGHATFDGRHRRTTDRREWILSRPWFGSMIWNWVFMLRYSVSFSMRILSRIIVRLLDFKEGWSTMNCVASSSTTVLYYWVHTFQIVLWTKCVDDKLILDSKNAQPNKRQCGGCVVVLSMYEIQRKTTHKGITCASSG